MKEKLEERITLSLMGKQVEAIRLDELAMILRAYQQILDRAYLAYQGKKRATNVPRTGFHTSVQSWKKGSIILDLLVESPALAQAALMINPISDLMEGVVMFYRHLHLPNHFGEKTVKIEGDNNIVNVVQGDNNIIVSNVVNTAAGLMVMPMQNIVRRIEKGTIETFGSHVSHDEDQLQKPPGFALTKKDVGIIDIKHLSGKTERMVVNIIQFNKKTGSGKLRIVESATIDRDTEIGFLPQKRSMKRLRARCNHLFPEFP